MCMQCLWPVGGHRTRPMYYSKVKCETTQAQSVTAESIVTDLVRLYAHSDAHIPVQCPKVTAMISERSNAQVALCAELLMLRKNTSVGCNPLSAFCAQHTDSQERPTTAFIHARC